MAKIFTKNGKRISQSIIDLPYTDSEGTQHPALWLRDPDNRAKVGIVETDIADPPEGFDLTYWKVQESDSAPFVTYEKKDEATCNAIWNERVDQQIEAMERGSLMPRASREFMLLMMAAQFPADALAGNPGYVKVKAFDDQIKELRKQKR